MPEAPAFSLVTEPWIACQLDDGHDALLSLQQVFDGSRRIVGIRGDSPTQDYAVLRVLLAIFWRAHHHEVSVAPGKTFDVEDWREQTWFDARSGEADTAALDYLSSHADRLDLLHSVHPFMQVADLHTAKDTTFPVARIIPEAESTFFSMRAGDALIDLSFAEATRWLIHTQAYDYSGIKSGAVGDPRVKGGRGYPIGTGWTGMTGGTTIVGATLRETLVLNTTADALDGGDGDRPVWERDPDTAAVRPVPQPAGAADLATWQARRIRLFPEDDRIVAVLVSNGDPIPAAGANVFDDPMTPYRYSRTKSTQSTAVYYPRPYETSRMMWRSLEPLIALQGDLPPSTKGDLPGKRPRTLDSLSKVRSGGLGDHLDIIDLRLTSASYGPKASSTAATVDARIDIPRTLLADGSLSARQAVLDAGRVTLEATKALGFFGGRLLVAAGGTYAFSADPVDAVLTDLEPAFRRWLRAFSSQHLESLSIAWQRDVAAAIRDHAQILLRGAGPKALIGREVTQNDRTSIMSAGTAYAQLRRDLGKALPLLGAQKSDDSIDLPVKEQTDDAA